MGSDNHDDIQIFVKGTRNGDKSLRANDGGSAYDTGKSNDRRVSASRLLSSGKKRCMTTMKSHKQFEDLALGKIQSRKNLEKLGWGTIKEQEEIDQKNHEEAPAAPTKPVVRRPFLARGTGKAGGIGAAPREQTPPKSRKTKSAGAYRLKPGQDLTDRQPDRYPQDPNRKASQVESQYQNPFVGHGAKKDQPPRDSDQQPYDSQVPIGNR